MTDRPHGLAMPAVLGALLALGACEPDEEPYVEEDLPPGLEEPAEAAPELGPQEIEPQLVELDAVMSDPAVSGEATILHEGGVSLVAIDLEGLPEAGEYAAHIHVGSCQEGGPPEINLEPVMALEDGEGSSMTTLEQEDLPDEDWFIQVHAQDGAPISCGDAGGSPDGA